MIEQIYLWVFIVLCTIAAISILWATWFAFKMLIAIGDMLQEINDTHERMNRK